jgi:glyoxylate/hydroxypyruvate reductase A
MRGEHVAKGRLLVSIAGWEAEGWVERFRDMGKGREVVDAREPYDPATIDYAAVWKPAPGSLAGHPNLKAIFNLGAGADAVLADPALPDVPVVRVVDPDLTARMTEYVTLNVLMHHRRVAMFRDFQAGKSWKSPYQHAAKDLRVGIMGMGELGKDAAEVLIRLGFQVAGWSRSGKPVEGVEIYGADGLDAFLGRTDILVVLLPLTPDTRGILNRDLFGRLARDGVNGAPTLINAGRGGLQVEADILAALDDGTLGAAALDVFEVEPLPATSPLWSHPRVTITPHNAADSDPQATGAYILNQIDDFEAGQPLRNVIDRAVGY